MPFPAIRRPRPCHAAVAALLALASAGGAAHADLAADLAGRWSGWGSIVMANGATEQVRCVVQYEAGDGGGTLRQSLRCASASYRVDAAADLKLDGGEVAGKWSEHTTKAEGSVRGRAAEAGLNLTVEGDHFSAAVAVTTAGCKQSITIAPAGLDVARVSITLTRC